MPRYRILSFDGGGIMGVLTLVLLERIVQEFPTFIKQADLLAGTSTGGIIALGLAHGMHPRDIRALYEQKGRIIFQDSWLDDAFDLGSIVGANYDNRGLEQELKRVFGAAKLGDLAQQVLIPAFDLDNGSPDPKRRMWAAKFFSNMGGVYGDYEVPVYKVALYTSAAPTYFPVYEGYIDGGVVANNPSVAAIAHALDTRKQTAAPTVDQIALCSLGSGHSLRHISGNRLDWGYAQWARPLVNILINGVMGVADYQCRQFLRDRYWRLNPIFPPGVDIQIDGVDQVGKLIEIARGVDLHETLLWIDRTWMHPTLEA
jgi:patatin-like phospholipase/acyl hydrolase